MSIILAGIIKYTGEIYLVLSNVSLVDSLIMKARTSSSVTSGSFSSFFSLLAPHGMLALVSTYTCKSKYFLSIME